MLNKIPEEWRPHLHTVCAQLCSVNSYRVHYCENTHFLLLLLNFLPYRIYRASCRQSLCNLATYNFLICELLRMDLAGTALLYFVLQFLGLLFMVCIELYMVFFILPVNPILKIVLKLFVIYRESPSCLVPLCTAEQQNSQYVLSYLENHHSTLSTNPTKRLLTTVQHELSYSGCDMKLRIIKYKPVGKICWLLQYLNMQINVCSYTLKSPQKLAASATQAMCLMSINEHILWDSGGKGGPHTSLFT